MDTRTILPAALILHFSLSVASERQFDEMHGVGLSGSVFQTFRRTTLQQCRRLCVYSSRCLSVSWSSSTRECELNSKKRDVESLQVSDSNLYPPVEQDRTQQGHPCVNHPCSSSHMCIPVNAAKAHVCVRVGGFIPPSHTTTTTATATATSDARPTTHEVNTSTTTARTLTLTATVATTSAALPTTLEVATTTSATPMSASLTLNGTTTSPGQTTSNPTATSAATTTPTPYNGTCVTDIDCAVPPGRTCFDGVCMCSIGYDLDEASVECRKLTECTSSFRSEFTLYVGRAIRGSNFANSTSKTAAECKQLCLHSNTVCKSFKTYRSSCFLQKVTWFDVDVGNHFVHKDLDHYQRRCNW